MRTSERSRAWAPMLLLLVLAAAPSASAAEEPVAEAASTEEMFRHAQRLAWDGQREEAKPLCHEILARKKTDAAGAVKPDPKIYSSTDATSPTSSAASNKRSKAKPSRFTGGRASASGRRARAA